MICKYIYPIEGKKIFDQLIKLEIEFRCLKKDEIPDANDAWIFQDFRDRNKIKIASRCAGWSALEADLTEEEFTQLRKNCYPSYAQTEQEFEEYFSRFRACDNHH